jgi:predicted DNA-binding transcriptional regulator YafY
LKILTETFTRAKKDQPEDLFENIIGMVYSIGKVERVVLSFSPTQGEYVKRLPFHRTQKVLIDDDKECRIELMVVPNYELTHLILMQGDSVKVLEPQWLADEIVDELENALSNYK